MNTIIAWGIALVVGLGFSLGIGHIATKTLIGRIRNRIKKNADQRKEKCEEAMWKLDVPDWLIGVSERTFFTILAAAYVPSAGIAMIAWLALKMLYNWGIISREDTTITTRSLAFSALLGNLSSFFFAMLGGIITATLANHLAGS